MIRNMQARIIDFETYCVQMLATADLCFPNPDRLMHPILIVVFHKRLLIYRYTGQIGRRTA